MEYIGTTWATDFRRISLPAWLACLPLQVPIIFLILVGMNSKASFVHLPLEISLTLDLRQNLV